MTRSFSPSCRLFFCLFLCALCLAAGLGTAAAAPAAPAPKQGAPTRVVAEKMTYDAAKQIIVFEGKVHVTRLTLQIWSEKLTLYLDNSGKKNDRGGAMGMSAGKAERIVAERNVRMKQEEKSGSCGKATYLVSQGKIIMEQNPVVNDGPNEIRGDLINYFTQTGRSEVHGNVDVRILTDDDTPINPGAILGGGGTR